MNVRPRVDRGGSRDESECRVVVDAWLGVVDWTSLLHCEDARFVAMWLRECL